MAVLNRHRVLILAVVVLSFCCVATATHRFAQCAKTKSLQSKSVYVLVAATGLKAGSYVSKENVDIKQVRVDAPWLKMPNVIVLKKPEDRARYGAQLISRDKEKGALLTKEDLMGTALDSLPLDMRGYSFTPETLQGWNHQTSPGDRVNLYWVGKHVSAESPNLKRSIIFLQNVRVIDVQRTKETNQLTSIVLSLTDDEIRAMLALDGGQLHMSLRNRTDKGTSSIGEMTSTQAIKDIEILQEMRIKRGKTGCRYPSKVPKANIIIETGHKK